MCELDWGFTTSEIRGWAFYGRIDNLKSSVKQSGQTLESVF